MTSYPQLSNDRKKKTLENSSTYIKEDYPLKVLLKRKELQEELKQEREKGKNVALRYDKIIVLNEKKISKNIHREDKTTNKRFLSESPETIGKSVENKFQLKNAKQSNKKNKTSDIASYMVQKTLH